MKKIMMGIICLLAAGLFTAGALSVNVHSLKDLSAKAAVDRCEPQASSDCESSATGTIYFGYRKVTGPIEEIQ